MFMKIMKRNSFPRMGLAVVAFMIFPLIGCGGGGGGGEAQSQPPATPTANINVSRTQVPFGDVIVDRSSDQTIFVENIGSATLNIGQIEKASASPGPFSLLTDDCSQKSFPPGGTCTFQIRFSPSNDGALNDVLNIPSNDPAENLVAVNVNGYGRLLNVSLNGFFTDSCPSKGKVLVTVTDKDANPLAGLPKDSFLLSENGLSKNVETVSQATAPISAALLLDYSPSMNIGTQVADMENAAKAFVDQLNSANADEAAIIKYAGDYLLIPPGFTSDKDALKTAIDTPYTGIYSAVFNAVWFATEETGKRGNRRAVVLISDGDDEPPPESVKKTLDEVIANAKSKGIPIFTIGLGTVSTEVLQRMANETGGRYFLTPNSADLNAIYLQVAEVLAGQYVVEYASPSSGSITLDLTVDPLDGRTGRATKSLSGCP